MYLIKHNIYYRENFKNIEVLDFPNFVCESWGFQMFIFILYSKSKQSYSFLYCKKERNEENLKTVILLLFHLLFKTPKNF